MKVGGTCENQPLGVHLIAPTDGSETLYVRIESGLRTRIEIQQIVSELCEWLIETRTKMESVKV